MRKLVVLLDPAHGIEVPGKRSPDRKFREYDWSRYICAELEKSLILEDFEVYYTNYTEKEIGLTNRQKEAQNLKVKPGQTKFLVSLHNNAAGDGSQWLNARGYEIYTCKGQTQSDIFADIIMRHLEDDFSSFGFRARVDTSDGDLDKESNFTVLMGKGYSAVLLEWLFQDNKEDVKMLTDNNINKRLVESLTKAMIEIDSKL